MPDFTIRLSPAQASDIANVCKVGARNLERIVAAVQGEPTTIRQENVVQQFRKVVGDDMAPSLRRVVFGLSTLTSRDLKKVPDILDGVTATLAVSFKDDARFVAWAECLAPLTALMQCESVFFSAKAIDISYDFERVLVESRILTSIRPVFNSEKTDIVGTTVVQTLRLDYIASEGGRSSLSLSLDTADMRALRDACDYGIKKASLAKQTIEQKWSMEAIMAGEDDE